MAICFVWREGDAYKVEIVDSIVDEADRGERLSPAHPNVILLEEFLKPMAISQYRLARALRRVGAAPPRL